MIEEIDPFMVETATHTEQQQQIKHDIFDDIEERPTVMDSALLYAASGLSVVPCALPSKRPPMSWLNYQGEIAEPDQIKRWYTKEPTWGLGVVCGGISGGLEVIDLDGGAFAADFDAAIKNNAPGLFDKLVIEQSPSGGRHYAYRCDESEGNSVIAKTTKELPGHKRGLDGLTTLIETRGQGGYIATVDRL